MHTVSVPFLAGLGNRALTDIKIGFPANIYHSPPISITRAYPRTMVCSLSGPTETMAMGVSNSSSRKAM